MFNLSFYSVLHQLSRFVWNVKVPDLGVFRMYRKHKKYISCLTLMFRASSVKYLLALCFLHYVSSNWKPKQYCLGNKCQVTVRQKCFIVVCPLSNHQRHLSTTLVVEPSRCIASILLLHSCQVSAFLECSVASNVKYMHVSQECSVASSVN